MKKYHCCIPGCNAYATLNNFLTLPCESQWRDQWLSRIERKDWVVDATTVACCKHFENPAVKTSTVATKSDKCEKNLILVNTKCAPSLFPNPKTSPTEKPNLYPQHMFCLYHRDREPPLTVAEMQNANTDFIWTYCIFKTMYPKRLEMFLKNRWNEAATPVDVTFYTTDFSETPRIPCTVTVNKNLCVTVTLAGRTVDPLDLTWILPVGGRLNRWSQLQIMLQVFGK